MTVASVFRGITAFGFLFYLFIAIAGVASVNRPYKPLLKTDDRGRTLQLSDPMFMFIFILTYLVLSTFSCASTTRHSSAASLVLRSKFSFYYFPIIQPIISTIARRAETLLSFQQTPGTNFLHHIPDDLDRILVILHRILVVLHRILAIIHRVLAVHHRILATLHGILASLRRIPVNRHHILANRHCIPANRNHTLVILDHIFRSIRSVLRHIPCIFPARCKMVDLFSKE